MNVCALDIPDDQAKLSDWLESHIVGLELRDLVQQLKAVGGDAEKHVSLQDELGDRLSSVLEQGLRNLPREQLLAFMRSPELLMDLQERVCIEGGDYWSRVTRTPAHQELIEKTRSLLNDKVDRNDSPIGPNAPTPSKPISYGQSRRKRRAWLIGLSSLAAAAALLLVVTLSNRGPAPWGWEKPDAFTAQLKAPDYLNHLADTAQEWFNKKPETKDSLIQRLRQFRRGCDLLQAAPHSQLVEADRQWLLERCRVWATKFDSQIASLEAGQSVTEVRAAADETVNKLIPALRERAKQAA